MNLKRSLTIQVKGNSYDINYPTVGQFMDIESTKVNLTRGAFGDMIRSGTNKGLDAVLMAEVIAHFIILAPDVSKHLKFDTFSSMDIIDFVDLMGIYENQIKPWIDGWYKVFNDAVKKVRESKNKVSEE